MFYLVNYRLFGLGGDLYETIIMLAYLFTIVSAALYFGFWSQLILFWLVPYITVFQVLGYFIEVSEHYPLVGQNTVDLYMTRNRFSPWYEGFFTSMHGENFHLVHHLTHIPHPHWHILIKG